MTGIRRQDIVDADIVDAVELASSGATVYLSGITVVSTTSGTNTVTLSGVNMVNDPDQEVAPGDIITLTGTSGANGTYVVATVIDDTHLTVTTAIVSSTGGSASFTYPAGSTRVGASTSSFVHSTATTVQQVLKDLDSAIGGSSLTAAQLDVVLTAPSDFSSGVVTGLSAAPLKVVSSTIYEVGVSVQSGLRYTFTVTQLNSSGFNWSLSVVGNEYWPGPGSLTVRVDYLWSST